MSFSKTALSITALGLWAQGVAAQGAVQQFTQPLPIPPVKEPKMSIDDPVTNESIDYYEIEMKAFEEVLPPNTQATTQWGYDGMVPGPMFIVEKDQKTVVRFINEIDEPLTIHLHGSYSRAPYDGWAEDLIEGGEFKDYHYPNAQSGRFAWYHDHAMDHTANNAGMGLAGGYIIHDAAEDSLGLPSGYGEYDIPLIFGAKNFNTEGGLILPINGVGQNAFGMFLHTVNGQPYPYLDVEPRKYRFRLLNAAAANFFGVEIHDDDSQSIPFQVIGSDSGLLAEPVSRTLLDCALAERWEIVIDFADYIGQNLTMRNNRFPGNAPAEGISMMRFIVSDEAVNDPSTVPSTLRSLPGPAPSGGEVDNTFEFARNNTSQLWEINGVVFKDVENRVLQRPELGEVQIWALKNGNDAPDEGFRAPHPVHVHLVDFRIISRTGGNSRGVLPHEEVALKDIAWIDPSETVHVEAHFAPYAGLYMFHCHNLVHEDLEMMAAFNVTHLSELGYEDDFFTDPMETRWRAKPVTAAAFEEDAIIEAVQAVAELEPYKVRGLEEKRDASGELPMPKHARDFFAKSGIQATRIQ